MAKKLCQYIDSFFPPPKYLMMDSVGVDISDFAIRFIVLDRKDEYIKIKDFGSIALPAGAVSGGIINDKSAVSKILADIRNRTKVDFINLSLPEERAYLFKVQLPKVSELEMREAVGFRIEENVPVPVKEAVFDYKIMGGDDKSSHLNVLVSLVPFKLSDTYSDVVTQAGFCPLKFEIASQAVAKSVIPKGEKRAVLVMNFGEVKTSFSIVHNGNVFFSSTVPVGSTVADSIIAKKFKVQLDKVEDIKSNIMGSGKQDMSFFMEVMNELEPIKQEISKLFVYWKTHSLSLSGENDVIEKIILCGKDTALPAVDEYVAGISGIKTEVANVWQNLFSLESYIPPMNYKDSLDYATAIGLLID
jgi:type IV pilus assembly protein PilM